MVLKFCLNIRHSNQTLNRYRHRYKIITGKVDMDLGKFFETARDIIIRGHQYKLFKRPAGSFCRFFSARVVDSWNKLMTNI